MVIKLVRCHLSLVLRSGRDGVTEAAEVRLLSLAHQLKVQRLLAEVAFSRGVGLQLQAHLLPCVHQSLWGGKPQDPRVSITVPAGGAP